jgi:aspartokinase/homoserine dehydrogenase 1
MTTDAFADFVVGHGEIWSAQLYAATCRLQGTDAIWMDTREVLIVTPTSDGASVDLNEDASNKNLDKWFKEHGNHKIIVATGFIAKTPQ